MALRRTQAMAMTAGVSAIALVLAACGSKASTSSAGGGTSSAASGSGSAGGATFTACMVTDTGGIDDKSFNASAWAGMQQAQTDGKAKVQYVVSKTEADYKPNIAKLEGQNCKLIVTVGGLMGDATMAAAKAKPSQNYAEVDAGGNGTNLQGLQFNTAQGAFLGGYLAAAYSKTGVVATYGGLKIAPVTIYMDGFVQGVQYYNQQKGKTVKVLGWTPASKQGVFAGKFNDPSGEGVKIANNFIAQNADVIFPVAGLTGTGSSGVAKSTGKAVVIWVDTDGFVSDPQNKSVYLTTVFKGIQGAVTKSVEDAAGGNFSAKDYIGDLSNQGTGLSPFHDFDSKVDAGLKTELTQLQQDIMSGKITITSPSQPKAS
jgi:basic membrane protein A and related proteins